MIRHLFRTILIAVCCLLPRTAEAQTAACDGLQGAHRDVALQVLKSQHPYDCCDGTIWECLSRRPICRLTTRLANDVCRRAAQGQARPQIQRALDRRAASMMPSGKKYSIDTSKSTPAGSGPVKLVAYMCARCPYCARLTPALYRSVTSGGLKDKVQLYMRLFPIRSHQHSTEGALALQAAQELGQFWPFVLHVYSVFHRFDPKKLPDCAASKGMDRQRFIDTMKAGSTRAKVVEAKKEGVRNQVAATPTLFINGRKYTGDLDIVALQDVLEEEWERVAGKKQ